MPRYRGYKLSKRKGSWFGTPFKENGKWYVVFHKAEKFGFTNYLYESKGPF